MTMIHGFCLGYSDIFHGVMDVQITVWGCHGFLWLGHHGDDHDWDVMGYHGIFRGSYTFSCIGDTIDRGYCTVDV